MTLWPSLLAPALDLIRNFFEPCELVKKAKAAGVSFRSCRELRRQSSHKAHGRSKKQKRGQGTSLPFVSNSNFVNLDCCVL